MNTINQLYSNIASTISIINKYVWLKNYFIKCPNLTVRKRFHGMHPTRTECHIERISWRAFSSNERKFLREIFEYTKMECHEGNSFTCRPWRNKVVLHGCLGQQFHMSSLIHRYNNLAFQNTNEMCLCRFDIARVQRDRVSCDI